VKCAALAAVMIGRKIADLQQDDTFSGKLNAIISDNYELLDQRKSANPL
jgi:hypothetical protein